MRLTEPATALDVVVAAVLDRRLEPDAAWPVALALSGGGDSTALMLAAASWGARRGRRLLVLTVDHRLQAESAAWTDSCRRLAARLGADFRALVWEGPKPASGLAAAARTARHALLAGAAREAGARVILLGHTADDVAEAALMRQEGSTTPSPRIWSPSPCWPEGRGVFLLRPLLALRRSEIRAWLAERGEPWIEDPANESPASARARARLRLAQAAQVIPSPETAGAEVADLARSAACDAAGVVSLPRAVLREASDDALRRFAAAACLCAAGTVRPPRRDRLARLVDMLRGDGPGTVTLAGARIVAQPDAALFMREPGEAARGGLAAMDIPAGATMVWDGRFEIAAGRSHLLVRCAAVSPAPELPANLRRAPAAARRALPVIHAQAGRDASGVRVRLLVHARLLAACGAIDHETAAGWMGDETQFAIPTA